MINQKRAYLYAGIAIFFWSTIATAFKIGLQEINLIQFLFFASWTSFLILLIINVYKGNLKKISDLGLKEIALSAFMGALNPFAYYLILFRAYELLPAQVAQPLNMIWPIVLVFFSVIFLGQKFRAISFLALFISFIGVYFISTQGDPWSFQVKAPLGVALAAGSSIIWSAYWILNVKKGGDETFQLGLNFFFAAIFISLLLLAIDGFQNLSLLGTGLAVYSGVFEMGITFLLWIKAMKLSKSNDRISNLVYIAPFLSLIFIFFLVGEQIYVTSLAGLSLIVLGILLEKIRLF
ncbi:MAG TPA: DMT family transporter [Bacteroides sp.]|nr:DMT family transporter [Bacteroides sp.]